MASSSAFIPVRRVFLRFKSYDKRLEKGIERIRTLGNSVHGLKAGALVRMPTARSRWTVIKGPFRDKKTQQTFQRKEYNRLIELTGEAKVVNPFVNCLHNEIFEPHLACKVIERSYLPASKLFNFALKPEYRT
eukprot:TRINITY_DN1691_c1_g1_i1.p1 TRINITY_DN1691_c1_g1~~TRINITY_DN1691_c1_g1_i1.p1  ORF type:complete len:133 (+),score=41.38 TRINITY_DN1691_c1_g1_i1:95-493(+)